MDRHRWMVCAGWVALLALTAGCVSDDVVYVDSQGNELAVDEDGQPLAPPGDVSVREPAPAVSEGPPQPAEPPPTRVLPRTSSAQPRATATPTPTTDWDLPPAGAARPPLDAAPATTPKAPVKSRAPAGKKIDSSDGLDLPPAG